MLCITRRAGEVIDCGEDSVRVLSIDKSSGRPLVHVCVMPSNVRHWMREGDVLTIKENVFMSIKSIESTQVRLGFDAPRDTRIWRRELTISRSRMAMVPVALALGLYFVSTSAAAFAQLLPPAWAKDYPMYYHPALKNYDPTGRSRTTWNPPALGYLPVRAQQPTRPLPRTAVPTQRDVAYIRAYDAVGSDCPGCTYRVNSLPPMSPQDRAAMLAYAKAVSVRSAPPAADYASDLRLMRLATVRLMACLYLTVALSLSLGFNLYQYLLRRFSASALRSVPPVPAARPGTV